MPPETQVILCRLHKDKGECEGDDEGEGEGEDEGVGQGEDLDGLA